MKTTMLPVVVVVVVYCFFHQSMQMPSSHHSGEAARTYLEGNLYLAFPESSASLQQTASKQGMLAAGKR